MFSSAYVVLALSASAFATVFVTSPVASTTFPGGQQCTVSWQDDGSAPTLAAFGPAMVSIYAGNSQQQTLLQTITPSVDVSKISTIQFTPDPTIGPNGDQYFIRFQSISQKDATNPQYPALAFSAKFTMSNMSGQFNASVQAQINGQSTAPIGGTVAASSTSVASNAATTAAKSTVASASGSKTTSKSSTASGAAGSSGAGKLAGAGVAAFAGVAIAVLSGLLC